MLNHERTNTSIKCPNCGVTNVFNQPYPYHAGFSDQGFLYNEAGNRTLTWDSLTDPDYLGIVGPYQPWILTRAQQQKLESMLEPGPGGRWLFANPARCKHCHGPISGPMLNESYYFVYDSSTHGIWSVLKVSEPNGSAG